MNCMKMSALFVILNSFLAHQAYAIDINAGDYTPLPAGSNAGVFYYQHGNLDGYYQDGKEIGAKSTADIGIARLIHYTDIAGIRVAPQIIVPFGAVRSTEIGGGRLNNASGFADPVIAAAFWLINQPEKGASGRHFAVTPFLYLPMGQYSRHDVVNLGENRFKFDLQMAWMQPLDGKFSFELYQDAIWYGDNDEAGTGHQTFSQDLSHQTQANLRYDLNPMQRISLGYAANYGGRQSLDGIDLNQDMQKQQLRFEYQQMINARTQLSAQAVSDTHVESGFKKDLGLNFRVFYIF